LALTFSAWSRAIFRRDWVTGSSCMFWIPLKG
jgi:hypothetical protein